MIAATFDMANDDQPRIFRCNLGRRRWRIELWVDDERTSLTTPPKTALSDCVRLAVDELLGMAGGEPVSKAGWQIRCLR